MDPLLSCSGADIKSDSEPHPAPTNPSNPPTTSPVAESPPLATKPMDQQPPALFADIVKELTESVRYFQPATRPQYTEPSQSDPLMDAQLVPPPRLDHRSSLPSQRGGTLRQSPRPVSHAFDPTPPGRRRDDTLGSSDGSPSLSSANAISDSSPSLPWLAPAAASSAASLPSFSTGASPPAAAEPFRPAREGTVELESVAPPSCLAVPMLVDERGSTQQQTTAFQRPLGGVPTAYARMSSSNLPWNMRYANFQGAGTAAEVPPQVPDKIPHDSSSSGGADAQFGAADGDKILGLPPEGEKMPSPGPSLPSPPHLLRATGPVLWGASAVTLVQPPTADERDEPARQVVSPPPPRGNELLPEALEVPPVAEGHSRTRARSVDASAGTAEVSPIVRERRRQMARHRIFDDQ